MKIALINENSQAPKNQLIYDVLKQVVEPLGHSVDNYGRYSAEDPHKRTYVQAGIMAALLLNSKAADFVVTGCGTGMGAMLACNAFPNVQCGFAQDPIDGFLFSQINNGNALSLPFAKGFGWGSELNLRYIFEKTFDCVPGAGYPPELAAIEQENAQILTNVKKSTHKELLQALSGIDRALLKGVVAEESFPKMFFENCKVPEIAEFVKELLA